MHTVIAPPADTRCPVEDKILEQVAHGTVLIGTLATLSQAMGVKVTDLRAALRRLLLERQIALSTEAGGQLTIRLERRGVDLMPALPPATERRRPRPDAWTL